MSFGKKKLILFILGIALVVSLFIIERYFLSWTAVLVLLAAVIGYLILNIKWWRCPHCGSYLWKLSPFADYCPYCGNDLE